MDPFAFTCRELATHKQDYEKDDDDDNEETTTNIHG